MTIGQRLRQARQARHLSLSALARESRLSKGFISQVEGGSTNASLASLRRLAQALSMPLAELIEDVALPAVGPPALAGPVLVRQRPSRAIGSSLSTVSAMASGTVVLVHMTMGARMEAHEGQQVGGKSGSMYCMVLLGDVRFREPGSSLRLNDGDSLTWAAKDEWVLENRGGSPASLLLFVPAAIDLPVLVDSSLPHRSIRHAGPLAISLHSAADAEGPLRLVAMRAARDGGRGR